MASTLEGATFILDAERVAVRFAVHCEDCERCATTGPLLCDVGKTLMREFSSYFSTVGCA
jgi:threonine dehydrogenase-like Zn-dependent dehydrogenase